MVESMLEVHLQYTTSMQMAAANYQMRDATFRSKVSPLKFRVPDKTPVAYFGTIDIGVEPNVRGYVAARAQVAANLFAADPILLRCVRLVCDESYW